jgi:hypothetical protein
MRKRFAGEALERLEALEEQTAGIFRLLQSVADVLVGQKHRIEEQHARLNAHTVLTCAVLHGYGRIAPDIASELLALLERSERDCVRSDGHQATVRELREILDALRAQQRNWAIEFRY